MIVYHSGLLTDENRIPKLLSLSTRFFFLFSFMRSHIQCLRLTLINSGCTKLTGNESEKEFQISSPTGKEIFPVALAMLFLMISDVHRLNLKLIKATSLRIIK